MTVEEMKQIKEERGYSMAQLSEYSGVPLGTLQKIFCGQTINPRKSTIDAIAGSFRRRIGISGKSLHLSHGK